MHSTLALYLFYLKTITSELHNSKSMHFSQVTVMYIVGMGQLEPGTGTKFSYITEITGIFIQKLELISDIQVPYFVLYIV